MAEDRQTGDQMMRAHAATLPVPVFEHAAFVTPPILRQATVAIVTSAPLHCADDEGFSAGDTSFRAIQREQKNLVLGHWSPNFDRTGVVLDLNVVFPIDRLEEMANEGVIGAVAPTHYSFAGNQPDDVATLRYDTGPTVAQALRAEGVDVVILTPV